MDFTREPIVESIITPKEGHRIVVRSSKNGAHEEYFLDSVEIVSFGNVTFLRSTEKPKPFLVPASDYEILEAREPRIPLKVPSFEGTVKVKQSKEQAPPSRPPKEAPQPPRETSVAEEMEEDTYPPFCEGEIAEEAPVQESPLPAPEERQERRKDKKNRFKKKKNGREMPFEGEGKEKIEVKQALSPVEKPSEASKKELIPPQTFVSTILPPPTTLIRDDIERLRKTDSFKGAFYTKEEKEQLLEEQEMPSEILKEQIEEPSPSSPMESQEAMPQSSPSELKNEPSQTLKEEVVPEPSFSAIEEEPGEEISPDAYKATPAAKESSLFTREPFWGPGPTSSI